MSTIDLRHAKPGVEVMVRFNTTHIVSGTFEGLDGDTLEILEHTAYVDRRSWWKMSYVEEAYREGAAPARRVRKRQNQK